MSSEAKLIDAVVTSPQPRYESNGWLHWPEHPWMSYQFRRGLGGTQEGCGAVSECFQAAARMIPGDPESWYTKWLTVADRNRERGDAAKMAGRQQTAQNCWLRAAHYYPTIGQEIIGDWLAERFGIDEHALRRATLA